MTTGTLAGETILMSGGSRGIGLAIGLRAARRRRQHRAARQDREPHPKLDGTIHTAASGSRRRAGAPWRWSAMCASTPTSSGRWPRRSTRFGGIDMVVNNASAIDLSPTSKISMKTLRPDAGHQQPGAPSR